jgi:uncharacterized protein (DUF4415 family)
MPKNNLVIKSDLKRVDAHVIQPEEYDEAPELTEEMLERADLYHGGVLIQAGKGGPNPRIAEAIRKTLGRPPLAAPKLPVKIRLDADLVEHLRATGPGWQTRVNDTLRKAAKLKRVG